MELSRIHAALVVPIFGTCALLGKRKVQPFKGTLSGYGGRLKKGERVLTAAVREWKEETGTTLTKANLNWCGVMDTHHKFGDKWMDYRVHLFWTRKWKGTIVTTEEMTEPIPIELKGFRQHKLCPEIELVLAHIASRQYSGIRIAVNDMPDGTTDICSCLL